MDEKKQLSYFFINGSSTITIRTVAIVDMKLNSLRDIWSLLTAKPTAQNSEVW